MPRKPRKYIETSFIHAITQGINKSYIFNEEQDIKVYIKSMYKSSERYNIKVIAYCIMNNHAHMLLRISNIENLSKYMQSINTKYGLYYNKKYNKVGYVFRNRYKSEGIYNERQLYNCIKYIYHNPVKAKICNNPNEYPYSNYKLYEDNQEEDLDEYNFLDIEDIDYGQVIKKYLERQNLLLENVLKEKEMLKDMVIYLKKEIKMSYRAMEKELNVSREKLRKLTN